MRTPFFWYVVLVALCIGGPYALGVRPSRRADWAALTAAISFLTWLLIGLAVVRAA
jgi:hypothetical protein